MNLAEDFGVAALPTPPSPTASEQAEMDEAMDGAVCLNPGERVKEGFRGRHSWRNFSSHDNRQDGICCPICGNPIPDYQREKGLPYCVLTPQCPGNFIP